MPFLDILVHRATPVAQVEQGEWVEGEFADEPVPGIPFDCCLFLPIGQETTPGGRSRRVTEPTLLYAPENDLGAEVALSPEDELLVVAPEINVVEGRAEDAAVRWMVTGATQPFGKPGLAVIGLQATLRRVED